jgi:hypothetical protein
MFENYRLATMPVIVDSMIIPALLYLFINYQEDGVHGWEFQWLLILPLHWIDGSARKQSARGVKGFICIGSF